MSHTAKTPPVAKGSNGLPVNAVDGTQAYDTDKAQYVVSVSNAWQGVGGGGGFGTPTVVYDDGAAVGNTDQIQGDIPANWKQSDTSLKGLVIGTSCTSIGSYAFSSCGGLTGSLTIPNSVTSIGNYAFFNCPGFNGSLTIPNSVTSIEYGTFYNCNGLTGSLTIGNSVTSIGSYAFKDCTGFNGSLTIPDSVTTIGNTAFGDCTSLTGSLTIPNSVTSIGGGAFNSCAGLTAVYTNTPASSFIGNSAFLATTFTTIYTGPNATGYTTDFQGRTGLTIANWDNYPNPIPN